MKVVIASMTAALVTAALTGYLLRPQYEGRPRIAATWTEDGVQVGLTLLLERGPYNPCYIVRDSHVDAVVCPREAGR